MKSPSMHQRLKQLAAPLLAALLAACAQAPSAPEAVFAPNANLVVQGIPPIPQSLVDRVARYTDFRGHAFVDWHPTQRQMLVAHRKAGDTLPQLYLVDGPLAKPQQLTQGSEPVWSGSFEPRQGQYLVFERSVGGNEAGQLHRLDLATRQTTLLTNPDERHSLQGWLHGSSRALVSSVPLDRTAQGGRRADINTTLWLTDPLQPGSRQVVAQLPGGGWFNAQISRDDRQIAITNYRSASDSEIWLIDVASGQRRRVLPAAGQGPAASHYPGPFTADGKALWLVSNRSGEFLEAMQLDLASGALRRVSSHIAWDASELEASADGRLLAAGFNIDGRTELRLFDGASGAEKALPRLPGGSLTQLRFHRASGELAMGMTSAQGPSQVQVLDPATGRVQPWTRAESAPGIDPSRFSDQQIIRWASFDGRSISGLISRPPARFTGKRPVLIEIHGGPEGQATVGFNGRLNYLVQELGITLIEPNVRGSSGFGKTFIDLDNGMKREDSVRDIGALLDWIAAQPDLDASRVMVSGGSYGGYMALACAVHYSDRLVGAIDDVGISHFVTFLNNTESYRRDLRRVEYGDERDPAMKAFLDRISPLTQAARIRKPLFVIQGKNDPRVPYTEAEQIVQRVRDNGTPVWYLRAENEGHGFVRKENADFRFYAMVKFIETVLKP
jgi:dienelactone hydrolase/Tol biopolymer transport system component